MDLDLSDDQQLFRETTERYLTDRWPATARRAMLDDPLGFDRELWTRGADLGWTSMLVPEDYGGGSISGQGVKDVAIVAELLGGALTPGPSIPTNVVAAALAQGGAEHLAKEHLPGIASGEVVATWTSPINPVAGIRTADGLRLSGIAVPVQDAQTADLLLVTAQISGGVMQALLPTRSTGVTVEPLASFDLTRRYCRVRIDDVQVAATDVLPASRVEHLLALALALQCAETVGATSVAFDFTLQYVKDRKAFGRPIGSFQALKHRLAEHALWLETAKAVTSAAIAAAQAEVEALDAARLAKAWVAERCPALIRDCLQMHGGIGFTWEHDVHLFLRRVDTNTAVYGGVDEQLDALAHTIGFDEEGS